MTSGLYTDEYCLEKLKPYEKARGDEYRVFVLEGTVELGVIEEHAKSVADWRRFQNARLPEFVAGTQKAIEILTARMEKPYGET